MARINPDTIPANDRPPRPKASPSNWFQRIGSWFSFVNNGGWTCVSRSGHRRRTTAAVCGAAILIILMMLLVDRQFLALVRSGATDGNTFFETITMIGKSDWILYGTGCVILVFTIFTADRFAGKLHRLWHRLFLTAYFIFTSIAFSGLITNGLKIVFGRLRPPKVEGAVPWEAVPFTPGYDYASFPSGHSTTSGALAMALRCCFPALRGGLSRRAF